MELKAQSTDSIPYPPWGTEKSWAEANWSIDYLICHHHQELQKARKIALDIHNKYQILFLEMEVLSKTTCPHCRHPCCQSAKPYFDFRDIIYLHLQNNNHLPAMQTIGKKRDHCRFISPTGCTLERTVRPFICTWYICPTQQLALTIDRNIKFPQLLLILKKIQVLRWQLEEEFIQTVS